MKKARNTRGEKKLLTVKNRNIERATEHLQSSKIKIKIDNKKVDCVFTKGRYV